MVEAPGLPDVGRTNQITLLGNEVLSYFDRGRDGCRVPLPWAGDVAPFGFADDGSATPWLPQPQAWQQFSVEAQRGDPSSMLSLYKTALRIRRQLPALGDGELWWLDECDDAVLAFARSLGFACTVNCSAAHVTIYAPGRVLLSSDASAELVVEDSYITLPSDTAVWWVTEQV